MRSDNKTLLSMPASVASPEILLLTSRSKEKTFSTPGPWKASEEPGFLPLPGSNEAVPPHFLLKVLEKIS